MKKWMLLITLCAAATLADEPASPPAPDTEVEAAVQAAAEAAVTEVPPPPGEPAPGLPGPRGIVPATQPSATAPATSEPSSTMPATTTATTNPATTTAAGPSTAPAFTASGGRFTNSRDGGRSSKAAASFPRTVAAAKPIPREFQLVLTRSIFIKGSQSTPEYSANPGFRPGRGVDSPTTMTSIPALHPEKTLLFNGAMDADGQWLALFEDTAVSKVLILKVGDKVARGRVAAMTLGTLDYDFNGKVKRILMGQNLDGEVIVATTRPSLATSVPTTAPAGADGAPAAPGGPMDILERMRLKRLQGN